MVLTTAITALSTHIMMDRPPGSQPWTGAKIVLRALNHFLPLPAAIAAPSGSTASAMGGVASTSATQGQATTSAPQTKPIVGYVLQENTASATVKGVYIVQREWGRRRVERRVSSAQRIPSPIWGTILVVSRAFLDSRLHRGRSTGATAVPRARVQCRVVHASTAQPGRSQMREQYYAFRVRQGTRRSRK